MRQLHMVINELKINISELSEIPANQMAEPNRMANHSPILLRGEGDR
jgi:hypothetical protein